MTIGFHDIVDQGSPPLVRERRRDWRHNGIGWRITPARAGKTSAEPKYYPEFEDHPRSCGKDFFRGFLSALLIGSPPLVRERHLYSVQGLCRYGITPARAGKTFCIMSLTTVP